MTECRIDWRRESARGWLVLIAVDYMMVTVYVSAAVVLHNSLSLLPLFLAAWMLYMARYASRQRARMLHDITEDQ